MAWRAVGLVILGVVTACASLAGLDGDYVLGESTHTSVGGGSNASSAAAGGAMQAGGAAGSAQGAGGGHPTCIEGSVHVAVVADCIDVDSPNPDACAAALATGAMIVDLDKSEFGGAEVHAYLRFDLGSVPSGLASLELSLVVADTNDAPSVSTGEVWRVTPFVRQDLFAQAPANVGQSPLAGDQGSAVQGATISWMLTPEAIDRSGSVFLAVRPVSDDGVEYQNLTGSMPPRLIVHCL